jgi:hypothetical protein
VYIQNDIVRVWRNGLYKIVWAWAISVPSTKAAHQTLLNLYLPSRKPFLFLSSSFSPPHDLSFFLVTLHEISLQFVTILYGLEKCSACLWLF